MPRKYFIQISPELPLAKLENIAGEKHRSGFSKLIDDLCTAAAVPT